MVENFAGGDKTVATPEPLHAHPLEASSQQMSKPGAAGDGGHAASAQKSSDMVSSGKLPGIEVVDDHGQAGKAAASDTTKSSAHQLEAGAAGVENLLKHNASAEDLAKAVNKSLEHGVPLDKLVDQINKDMPYPPGINFKHAVIERDASGKPQELAMSMSPIGGLQFKIDGAHVTPDSPKPLESGAAAFEKLLKEQNPTKDTAEEMAKVVNRALEQGITLDKFVDQINKDMPYPPGVNFKHAVLESDASGKPKELVVGMGPFAGPQFKVDGAHVTVDYPQR